jgi:hypothetical protein
VTENAPVPYPTAGFAYPVAPPVPAFAPAKVSSPDIAAPQVDVAPSVVEAPAPAIAQQQVEKPKFFPLVPTETSKFVSQPVIEASLVPAQKAPPALAPPELVKEITPAPAQEHVSAEPASESIEEVQEVTAQGDQLVESPFDISSSLNREPQTNSIVLDQIPDALTVSDIITDAGQILATGSIELPTLTGEVTIVSDSPEADQADLLDSASVTISTVAPVRAPSVINSKAQLGVLPSKRRKSQGQLMAMLTLSIMIVTVGTLYAMAAILGFIK